MLEYIDHGTETQHFTRWWMLLSAKDRGTWNDPTPQKTSSRHANSTWNTHLFSHTKLQKTLSLSLEVKQEKILLSFSPPPLPRSVQSAHSHTGLFWPTTASINDQQLRPLRWCPLTETCLCSPDTVKASCLPVPLITVHICSAKASRRRWKSVLTCRRQRVDIEHQTSL